MEGENTFVPDTRNKEFQDALNLIRYTRQSVFLTGKAGTGKSTFLKYICANKKENPTALHRQSGKAIGFIFLFLSG